MTTEHVEVERKFEADETFSLPDLTGVEGVAAVGDPEQQTLEAIYYDTPDLRLLRSKVTLRRRTGGADAGWHVKLPGVDGARRELHQPLGRAARTAPRTVVAPVLGLLGTAAAEPVATVATRRVAHRLLDEAGRVLAEVADDAVVGTALATGPGEPATVTSWREVEVELVDGDATLLEAVTERLTAVGARPSAVPSKLGRVLEGRLPAAAEAAPEPAQEPAAAAEGGEQSKKGKAKKKKAKAEVPGRTAGEVVLGAVAGQLQALREADLAVRSEQPEGVHDLRVACRRLRSIFAAFRPVLAREHTDPLRDELRWVGAQLSGARDTEVALAHLRELVAAQPPELVLGPVAARLQQTEVEDHEAGARRVTRTLTDRRYLRLLDALDGLVADPPATDLAAAPAPAQLADAVRRTGKRLRRAVEAAREAEGADRHAALHEVRKATKRVRYTAEVAECEFGAPAAALVECTKQVQDLLGAAQDTVVTRDVAVRVGRTAAAAGENAWTYGRLHGLEEARAEVAEAEFWTLERGLRRAVKAVASLA
ncbi:CYTH and CHAD domain-containing protein [Geodermatophilus sp. DF01-2]|uniref:CYTH and CHAD domain-containing protein n=1 Tax=Geodermatophilus sp. DF01-2 TaxID=2559610 RepID=UPI0010748B26|nr:CYTH and CHAD domain-containing protein [Geodermatophilus sp. DF01_2]TFV57573.1 CYTH and CHAD domain-containing protein [Geodermatophilus sp. DF01_2]